MIADLDWLGLKWDEGPHVGGDCGPYRQSERFDIYKSMAQKLIDAGAAYRCFATESEHEAKREESQTESSGTFDYSNEWRNADPDVVAEKVARGDPYTVRFKVMPGSGVSIQDMVRGKISWDAESTLSSDFVLLRSSGVPVYNFCVAVDDAMMAITHVIRAEEHLTNTLRQGLILKALGYNLPQYAHASLILGEDRSKLSKRHGATSILQFKQQVC
jgi:glutamyl-tRNA synthetase